MVPGDVKTLCTIVTRSASPATIRRHDCAHRSREKCSIPARNSASPKRSSCAGSHPDVCVFLYEDAQEPADQSLRAGGGSVREDCLWIWKRERDRKNGQFNAHVHHSHPGGETLRSAAELIRKCPAVA